MNHTVSSETCSTEEKSLTIGKLFGAVSLRIHVIFHFGDADYSVALLSSALHWPEHILN